MKTGYVKLEPEFKKKWLAALRSGDYDQGIGRLCRLTDDGARYCCLGVAAEVEHGEEVWDEPNSFGELRCRANEERSVYTPPSNEPGRRIPVGTLMSMNDSQGKSFEEIADWIEENL